ncbi:immunoglobulin superfamily member 1 isoform X2 [Alligator mississippiensis]|uniref:immunoglobulin superfamily member 1 isoform X2 n=1 Tax=Alligator mississippiensis TaxID=8496 RepID=UPI002877E710|nr:immunoglobulin superfamily member 1 isoform X2 [Alligator mississippiensis]
MEIPYPLAPRKLRTSRENESDPETKIGKLCAESGLKWTKILPLALMSIRMTPRRKLKLSPYKLLFGHPVPQHFPLLLAYTSLLGDEGLTSYILSLQSQLKSLHRYAALSQPLPADIPAHGIQPGDWVYVKTWKRSPLEPKWQGPYQVLLTSHTAVKVAEKDNWIHYTHTKKTEVSPELRIGSNASFPDLEKGKPEEDDCRIRGSTARPPDRDKGGTDQTEPRWTLALTDEGSAGTGCWLAPQSRAWGEYPKPPISVIPSWVVALGWNITIRCEGLYPGMKFYLYKTGHTDQLQQEVPGGNVSEFPITKVSWEDGGSYTCNYHPIVDRNSWSYLSDPVELVVREPSHPKPSISLCPSTAMTPGGTVTIRCRGTHLWMKFVLNKVGSSFPPQDAIGFQAQFVIPSVSTEHSGSYSCYYHSKSDPFTVSESSDPVELVVRDLSYPRPKISLSNSEPIAPGQNVTIRCVCRCQHQDLKFFLHKAGAQQMLQPMKTMGKVAEFFIPSVTREHRGSYSCSYRPQGELYVLSYPSNPVEIVVTEPKVQWNQVTSFVIAVVCSILLLLLVAFLCYRRLLGGKGWAPIWNRDMRAPEDPEPVYSSVTEGNQAETLPQDELHASADGITYTELNHECLNRKRGNPAPTPTEPILYSMLKICYQC